MNNLNESYKKHSRLFLLVFIFLAAVVVLIDIMLVANRNGQIYKSKAATGTPQNALELASMITEPTVEEIVKIASEYPSFTAFMNDLDLSFPDQLNLLDALGNEAVSRLASASAAVDEAVANPQAAVADKFKKYSSNFLDVQLAYAATYVYIVGDIYSEKYEIANSSLNVKSAASRKKCVDLKLCKEKYSYDDLKENQKKAVDTLPKEGPSRDLAIDGFGLANDANTYATSTGEKDPEALESLDTALQSADMDLQEVDPNKGRLRGRMGAREDILSARSNINSERIKLIEKKDKEQDEKITEMTDKLTEKQKQLEKTQAELQKELAKGTSADEEALKKLLKDKEDLIKEMEKLKKEISELEKAEKEVKEKEVEKAKEEAPEKRGKTEQPVKQPAYCTKQNQKNQQEVGNCISKNPVSLSRDGEIILEEGKNIADSECDLVSESVRGKGETYYCVKAGNVKGISDIAGEVKAESRVEDVKEGAKDEAADTTEDIIGGAISGGAEAVTGAAGGALRKIFKRGEKDTSVQTGECACQKFGGQGTLGRIGGWIKNNKGKLLLTGVITGGVISAVKYWGGGEIYKPGP